MRTTYLVCYDIADEKRLRRVYRICRNHGNHIQFSIFECDLTKAERTRLETELTEVMNLDADQVLFVSLGPSEGRGERVITALGMPYTRMDAPCYVV